MLRMAQRRLPNPCTSAATRRSSATYRLMALPFDNVGFACLTTVRTAGRLDLFIRAFGDQLIYSEEKEIPTETDMRSSTTTAANIEIGARNSVPNFSYCFWQTSFEEA
jgi:hypothetical protein